MEVYAFTFQRTFFLIQNAIPHGARAVWRHVEPGPVGLRSTRGAEERFLQMSSNTKPEGEIDPADSEFQGLVPSFVQKRDLQTYKLGTQQ